MKPPAFWGWTLINEFSEKSFKGVGCFIETLGSRQRRREFCEYLARLKLPIARCNFQEFELTLMRCADHAQEMLSVAP